jgi:hypothetical protein
MTPVWTDDCDCREAAVRKPGFKPFFFEGDDAEGRAIEHQKAAERRLRSPIGGPTHWAFHANGRHLLGFSEGRKELG